MYGGHWGVERQVELIERFFMRIQELHQPIIDEVHGNNASQLPTAVEAARNDSTIAFAVDKADDTAMEELIESCENLDTVLDYLVRKKDDETTPFDKWPEAVKQYALRLDHSYVWEFFGRNEGARRCLERKGFDVHNIRTYPLLVLNRIMSSKSRDDARWREVLEELKEYKQEHHHCNVPQGSPLGSWVSTQRQQYRKLQDGKSSPMTLERIVALNEIGFAWNAFEQNWEDMLEELKEYKRQNRHCDVPQGTPPLCTWVRTQRQEYKKLQDGKTSAMTAERIAALDKIGFSWNAQDAVWQERLSELEAYKQEHQHCNVPQIGSTLGSWVHEQRKDYKNLTAGKNSPMTPERITALNKIGFRWNVGTTGKSVPVTECQVPGCKLVGMMDRARTGRYRFCQRHGGYKRNKVP